MIYALINALMGTTRPPILSALHADRNALLATQIHLVLLVKTVY